MRSKISFIFVGLVLLVSSLQAKIPAWYYNVLKANENTYIGYGQAKTEREAKSLALQDIASQISVKVKGTFSSATVVDGSAVQKKLKSQNFQKSQADISDYKRAEFSHDAGVYYIALSYENISVFNKFIKKVKTKLPKKDEKQNGYLSQTQLAAKLKKNLGVDIDFSLQRKDALWYISYKDVLVALDKRGFESLFKTTLSDSMRLDTSKKNRAIFDGEAFHFKYKSDSKGYVSIVTVYEDGTVSTLVNNIPVKAGKVQMIPDKDFESELVAGLISAGEETFDLYVAVFSKSPIVMDDFAAADASLITHERYKNFDTLMQFLEGRAFTSLKVVTKPR